MVASPTLKMFGLQRSCTNVVLKGLKANFHVQSVEHGREWKHGPVKKSGEEVQCLVFCFKEPLAWLVSMYRFSFTGAGGGCPHFRRNWSFEWFLASPHYDWPTPLDRWNAMNRHYLEWIAAHPQRGIAVRGEDLMSPEDAGRQYLRIGQHFGLVRRSESLHVFRRRITPTQRITRRPMNYGYYRDRRYLVMYLAERQAAILANADPWVMAQLSYQTSPALDPSAADQAGEVPTATPPASSPSSTQEAAPHESAAPTDREPPGPGRVQPQPRGGRGV